MKITMNFPKFPERTLVELYMCACAWNNIHYTRKCNIYDGETDVSLFKNAII